LRSRTTRRFREALRDLPPEIQSRAREAFTLFKSDPRHPSLRVKQVAGARAVYSVRLTRDYRALGVLERDTMIWFWIGSHADYDRLLSSL
jgi:hypothetical protein